MSQVHDDVSNMQLRLVFEGIQSLCLRGSSDRPISKMGQLQNWLIDLRPALLKPDLLHAVANLFWERFGARAPFQVATLETAGIPLLTAIMLTAPTAHAKISGFIIRKSRKTTGMGQLIEGSVTSDPIVLVDDIFNSSESAEKARVAIDLDGRSISDLFAIIDYNNVRGRNWSNQHSITVNSLFKLSDFGLSFKKPSTQPKQEYRELWRQSIPGGFPYHVVPKSTPIVGEQMIFRGCDAGIMHAFDVKTGTIRWAHEARGATQRKGIWSSPAYHDGRLYYGAYNGVVYCLDGQTGNELWTQSCCEWIGSSPLVVPKHELLFIGLEYQRPWAQGAITALDLRTGSKVWEHLVRKYEHGSASYWRGGDLIIWGTADHQMIALKPATGEIVWSFATRRSVKYPAAINEELGLVAFASFDQSIYLLDARTGEKRGEWMTNDICYTTPLFVGTRLFCGSGDRHLYVIDVSNGEMIKKIEFDARVYSSPRLLGDRVIFGTSGGRVIELDINSLEIKGAMQLPDAITNAIVSVDNGRTIVISTYMNHLFAFERL